MARMRPGAITERGIASGPQIERSKIVNQELHPDEELRKVRVNRYSDVLMSFWADLN